MRVIGRIQIVCEVCDFDVSRQALLGEDQGFSVEIPVVSAAILALGALFDFVTGARRPGIYERFYRWWWNLSRLDLESAGERGALRAIRLFESLFGRKISSLRSLVSGSLFIVAVASAFSLFRLRGSDISGKGRIVHTIVYTLMTLGPGLLSFQGSRLLLAGLRQKITFVRLLLVGIGNIVLLGLVTYFSYLAFGVFTVLAVKVAFNHHLVVTDLVPVLSVLILTALGVISIYLPIAILPTVCCMFCWGFFVLLYLSSRFGVWTKHFLRERIEQEWRAPFTHIAGVVVSFLWVGAIVVRAVEAANLKTVSNTAKEIIMVTSGQHGSRLGVFIGIMPASNRASLAAYYVDWGNQSLAFMQPFLDKGLPTPEEVQAMLKNHLPRLAQQWEAEQNLRSKNGAETAPTPSPR